MDFFSRTNFANSIFYSYLNHSKQFSAASAPDFLFEGVVGACIERLDRVHLEAFILNLKHGM